MYDVSTTLGIYGLRIVSVTIDLESTYKLTTSFIGLRFLVHIELGVGVTGSPSGGRGALDWK